MIGHARGPASQGSAPAPDGRHAASAAALNARLEGRSLEDALATAAEAFDDGRLAVLSAFGPGSLVLIHALHELSVRLPVLFIDTLHHFPETLQHVERVRDRYDLDLRVFRACDSRAEFENHHGPRLWERDLDRYHQISKVEPFRRAIADFDGWITGRRREQSDSRADLPLASGSPQIRVNPLAPWTRADVWRFILARGVPYNPLHDCGYTSIGDQPLTSPAADDEPERAGRWRGSDRSECGIHLQ
ncbi:MAG: phosphoadenylyl-sulfate reductase [Gemmatimonadota bacterium]